MVSGGEKMVSQPDDEKMISQPDDEKMTRQPDDEKMMSQPDHGKMATQSSRGNVQTQSDQKNTNARFRREQNPEILGQIRYVAREDQEYPEQLRNYPRMPSGLYLVGNFPDPGKKTVAIVGARMCSPYGRAEAIRFGEELAAEGVQIISGMAYGVDSWALHGALQAGGQGFAVLGCGVDVCYPKESYHIYRRIIREGGGIMSEFEPGDGPAAWHFPIRNRIISALADVVLVVEAKLRSGSLITADYALSQGKTIYAVPGRNLDELSRGCNRLIAQGAGIAWDPEVILEELGIAGSRRSREEKNTGRNEEERVEKKGRQENGKKEGMTGGKKEEEKKGKENGVGRREGGTAEEKAPRRLSKKYEDAEDFQKVFGKLSYDPQSLDTLQERTGMELSQLTRVLVQLTFSGYVHEAPAGYYSRS
ncbi:MULTISPECIES: DNA-processing protein DprA [unclassified Bilifractor]